MHNLLLFYQHEEPFSVEALDRIFGSAAGFSLVRYNTPTGTPIEADYAVNDDFTTVRLDSQRETISISGTSNAALQAAWTLQTRLQAPLRIVDTDYSFDLVLSDFETIDQLQAAIDKSQAG